MGAFSFSRQYPGEGATGNSRGSTGAIGDWLINAITMKDLLGQTTDDERRARVMKSEETGVQQKDKITEDYAKNTIGILGNLWMGGAFGGGQAGASSAGSTLGKEAGKEVAKQGGKTVAQEAGKEAAKQAAEEAAKIAAEEEAKRLAAEEAARIGQEIAKQQSIQPAAYDAFAPQSTATGFGQGGMAQSDMPLSSAMGGRQMNAGELASYEMGGSNFTGPPQATTKDKWVQGSETLRDYYNEYGDTAQGLYEESQPDVQQAPPPKVVDSTVPMSGYDSGGMDMQQLMEMIQQQAGGGGGSYYQGYGGY